MIGSISPLINMPHASCYAARMGRSLCFLFVFLCACSTDSFTSGDSGADAGGDGAVDAGPPDCGTGPTFCQQQPPPSPGTFGGCDDFDESTISNNGWTADTNGTPTAALDVGDYASCPASLLIDVPTQTTPTGNQFAHFYLTQSIPSAPLTSGKVVLDFEAKLPKLPTPDGGATGASDSGIALTDGLEVVLVRRSNDLSYNVRIERSADGFWFLRMGTGSSGGVATEVSAPLTPLEGVWNHITLTIQFSSSATGGAQMTYTTVANQPALAKTPPGANTDGSGAALNVNVGAAATTATSQEWFFGYDNVVLSAD